MPRRGPLWRARYELRARIRLLTDSSSSSRALRRRGSPAASSASALSQARAHAAVLSDSLLSAYCALRDTPEEAFSVEAPERERYALMGAVMVAQDAANAEMERCVGKQPA